MIRQVEMARFNRALRERAQALGKSVKTIVKQETKVLARDLVNFTPPQKAHSRNNFRRPAPQEQRKQGESAVKMDIERVFQPLDSIDIVRETKEGKLKNDISRMRRKKDYTGLAKFLHAIGVLTYEPLIIQTVDSTTADLHEKKRNARGRMSRTVRQPHFVVNGASIRQYIRKKQKLVGTAKSGWVKTLQGLKMGVPKWIDKGGPGFFSMKVYSDAIKIRMKNSVAYAQKHYPNIVTRALQKREKQMAIKTKYDLKAILEKRAARAAQSESVD